MEVQIGDKLTISNTYESTAWMSHIKVTPKENSNQMAVPRGQYFTHQNATINQHSQATSHKLRRSKMGKQISQTTGKTEKRQEKPQFDIFGFVYWLRESTKLDCK